MSKLVITEKPSVGVSIAKVLGAKNKQDGYYEGNGYYITWRVGHLVELAPAEWYDENYSKWSYDHLPIIPTEFEYNVSKGKEKQMKIIDDLMKNVEVTEIICATDAGREGQLIFELVYHKLNCKKPVKRLWISSLEDESIIKGFDNLKSGADFQNLYHAALCRAKADWIVGINATRLFSCLYGQTLNIGRVMSPTLAMIVERNLAIETFKAEPFYTVVLDCGDFSLTSEKIKDKEQAESLKNATYSENLVIDAVEQKEKTINPPKLYDLTTLQREANKILGFTAKQTLEYAQSLYEKKLCTYPRTDSKFLTEDMAATIPAIVEESSRFFMPAKSNLVVNAFQVVDNKKVTDHHAIIPTNKVKAIELNTLPFGEREILKLIAIRLLVAVNEKHIYSETIITSKCGESSFSTKGKTIIRDGFKAIHKLCFEGEDKVEEPLPDINVGDNFIVNYSINEGKTYPPKEFTDDTLLSAMENANNAEVDLNMKGIGTPATRAGIIEKLIKSGLMERKGDKKTKRFIPTHKGIALITVLPEVIQSPLLTAEWEEKLKQIELGELNSDDFLNGITEMTTDLVNTYDVVKGADTLFPREKKEGILGSCPRCGANVRENRKGFCCDNKGCKFAIWKENKFFAVKKKTVTKAFVKELLTKGKAPLKGCYSEKSGKIYDCIVVLDDSVNKYVSFKVEFEKI